MRWVLVSLMMWSGLAWGEGEAAAGPARCPWESVEAPGPDAAWRLVRRVDPDLPVSVRLPPALSGAVYRTSATQIVYVIAPRGGGEATLQIALDRRDAPAIFLKSLSEQGATVDSQVAPVRWAGRPAHRLCATIRQPTPAALVARPGGAVRHPARIQEDLYHSVYFNYRAGLLRAGYRVPRSEAARWQPLMAAVLKTVEVSP